MICMSWNGFCMIRVGGQLPDGLTRDVRSLRWSVMVKWPPTPPKIEKNKFVLKCILGHFQYFEPMFFLVENRPIRPTPFLVENSTNFFWNLPLGTWTLRNRYPFWKVTTYKANETKYKTSWGWAWPSSATLVLDWFRVKFFFVTCVIDYFLVTYKSSQNFSRKIAWYSEVIFRWGSHRLSHLYKQYFLFVRPPTKLTITTGWLTNRSSWINILNAPW